LSEKQPKMMSNMPPFSLGSYACFYRNVKEDLDPAKAKQQ